MALYVKITPLPDGGLQMVIWETYGEFDSRGIEGVLGEPFQTILLSPEQVVNSRDAVGTFVSIPGGLDMATE